MKIGFDNEKYLEEQSKYILERVNNYDKLYLEFGGKILCDYHAKRVLPGFDENSKVKLLHKMCDKVEVIICIYSGDIEKSKIRGDFGITYDMETLRLIDELRSYDLEVNSVVITRYDGGPATNLFINRLERRDIKVYLHQATKGYPTDVDTIVSEEGYGQNPYIETTKPIVVVTAPGPNSGKLATCLSQLYHEYIRGTVAGYSKFETFPIWNIPLKHPVNIAYEAATVDLKDVNMIDPFHFDAYNEIAVNYNRDVESFPVLKRIIEKITSNKSEYKSPTDMGVNRAGFGIVDDEVVREAASQEIISRFFKTGCDYKKGMVDKEVYERSSLLMKELNLKPEDRKVVMPARERAARYKEEVGDNEIKQVVAIELEDGMIVTGKASKIMCATAAAIINAVKYCAKISDSIHLISPLILKPIIELKTKTFGEKSTAVNADEILIALSICAVTNPIAQVAMDKLEMLKGAKAHSTTILNSRDEQVYRKLHINVTSDPEFPSDSLYY